MKQDGNELRRLAGGGPVESAASWDETFDRSRAQPGH
jgi:hypothetical protein